MHDDCGLTLQQWIGILSVSTRFECDKMRDRAIKEIHQHRPRINPVNKIVLAHMYHIPEWYVPSYAAICQRTEPLTPEEGRNLGLDIAILLAQAREAARQESATTRESTSTPTGGTTRGGGRGGRAGGRSQTTLPQAEPEPRPSTASLWKEWEGLTVPDAEEPFDAQRVADIIREIFPTADPEKQTS